MTSEFSLKGYFSIKKVWPTFLLTFLLLTLTSFVHVESLHAETSHDETLDDAMQGLIKNTMAYGYAPIYVPGKAVFDYLRRSEDKFSIRDEIKENGKYLVGWAAYKSTKAAVLRGFFITSFESYIQATERSMPHPPKRALLFSSFAKNDFNNLSVDLAKHELEARGAQVEVVELAKPEDLFTQLERLNKAGKKFDLIQFEMHGSAGQIHFPSGDSLEFDELVQYTPEGLKIAEPGATIRIGACGTGGHGTGFTNMGKKFMKSIGDRLLPQGGQVFASPKSIYTGTELQLAKDYLLPFPNGEGGYRVDLGLFSLGVDNNPFLTLKDAKMVKIPPKSGGCPKLFEGL